MQATEATFKISLIQIADVRQICLFKKEEKAVAEHLAKGYSQR